MTSPSKSSKLKSISECFRFRFLKIFALMYLLASAAARENRQCRHIMDCKNVCTHGGLCNENGDCVCKSPNAAIQSGPPCSSDDMCIRACGGNGGYCNYLIGACNCQ